MFAPATVVGRGNRYGVQHGDDSGLIVRFYFNKVKGRDYIKINVPGDSKTEWDRPVKDEDRERFKVQWDAYMEKQNQFGKQTTLEDSGLFNENQVKMYHAFNVYTIENLASINDSFISKMGPGVREDQKKARLYLADLNEKARQEVFEAELRKRDNKIAVQDTQIKELQSQVAQLLSKAAPEPKPRGRKRNDAA